MNWKFSPKIWTRREISRVRSFHAGGKRRKRNIFGISSRVIRIENLARKAKPVEKSRGSDLSRRREKTQEKHFRHCFSARRTPAIPTTPKSAAMQSSRLPPAHHGNLRAQQADRAIIRRPKATPWESSNDDLLQSRRATLVHLQITRSRRLGRVNYDANAPPPFLLLCVQENRSNLDIKGLKLNAQNSPKFLPDIIR